MQKRVLVLGSEFDLVELFGAMLRQRGYAIESALSIATAIDLIEQMSFDCVVMRPQAIDGPTIPFYATHLVRRRVGVVLASGNPERHVQGDAFADLVTVQIPVKRVELLDAVRQAILERVELVPATSDRNQAIVL